jgi:hypothetical protein
MSQGRSILEHEPQNSHFDRSPPDVAVVFSLLPGHVWALHSLLTPLPAVSCDEAALNSVAGEVRAMSIMGHWAQQRVCWCSGSLCQLSQFLWSPPPLMHAGGGTLPTAWQGE